MLKKEKIVLTNANEEVTKEVFDKKLWPEMKKTANYFREKGVTHLNLRCFSVKPTKTIVLSIEESDQLAMYNWIVSNKLWNQTIHTTMNPIKMESVGKSSIGASDIESFQRLLIDVDTERPKGTSANDQMLVAANEVMKNIVKLLQKFGIKNYLLAHSGNGKHVILEGDFDNYPKEFPKQLIQAIGFTSDTEQAKVDQVTFDSPRVTKQYGCMARKGEASEVVPHRQSYIEEICEDKQPNDLSQLYKWATSVLAEKNASSTKNESKTITETKNKWVKADAKKWAAHYKLPYKVKQGEKPDIEILVFDNCPMKEHTNSTAGFSLIQSGEFVQAKCLHESHSDMTIWDFTKKYPLPSEAKIVPKAVEHEALLNGQQYDFFPFLLSNDGLTWKKEEKKITIASAIYISSIRKSLETGLVEYEIKYKSNGYWEEKWVSGDFLQVGMLKKMSRFGLESKANFEPQVIDFLVTQKQTVPVHYLHSTIGWRFQPESEPVFHLYKAFGNKADTRDSHLAEGDGGSFDLKPIGKYEVWLGMVKNEVVGTYMEMMLAVGFASTVFAYLKGTNYPDLTAPVINLSNKTSTGKSTAQLFGVSMFASPSSAMDSMNATLNSIIATLSDNHGVPYALDELAANTTMDITQLVYIVSTGKDRKRMTQKGKLRTRKTFSTIVILSSENPLSVFMKNETGIRPRLIDFHGKIWTKNATSAERIKEVSTYNHGQAANKFIEQLFREGHELIIDVFEQEKALILQELPESAVKGRVANNYALITTAAQMVIKLLDIPLRYDFIKDELIAIEKSAIENQELEEQSIEEKVLEWAVSNGHHFVQFSNAKKTTLNPYGYTQLKAEFVQVNILKNKFEEIVKVLAKVENPKRVIKELIEKKVIFKEGDRSQKRISVKNKRLSTYELHLDLEYSPYFSYSLPRGATQAPETHCEEEQVETPNQTVEQPMTDQMEVDDVDLEF
ncbi:DUF927 domain-containing protein [Candidatus Enterococcus ikei]|uniref:DUF927 domain-containing protein n=1 Tax=Candidatus Enterococcus ikei TaxID=2815326 RepID=A0ABS3GW44_9ENTE|nr:DUF927 domain-containing protein [Enterococcus sp. DIV0869a]MBO0438996.1 DUF927 domain-containing protein [Enterococcus sp. DIV0869a]